MKQLFLSMLFMLLPLAANADAVEIDGIYYNLVTKGKVAEVTNKPNGYYSGSVDIPATVTYDNMEYSVTSIGQFAFSSCSALTSVSIPNSVTSIGWSAFFNCSGLTSVTIPNSVTAISDYTFSGCSNLTSMTIPNSVTTIGGAAFSNCSGLTSVTIPNSVTAISDYTFSDCSSLTSMTIPNSVTTIGGAAFFNCSGLTSVTIPNSVTSIGEEAFRKCSGLISVTIPNSVTAISDYTFSGCSSLTSMTIPNSVTSIGDWAFSGCSALTSMSIPNSLTSIGDWAFSGCSALTSMSIPNSVTSIGDWAFSGCSALISMSIPNSVTSIGSGVFNGCSGLTSVTIPNSVTTIGDNTFLGCSSLTSVTIPNSVTSIGNYAFSGCTALTSVTIPNSVTSIGHYALYNCSGLTSVTIGSGVQRINGVAFANSPELTDVYCYATTVPNTDNTAFDGSYIEYATLHVPEEAIDSYKTTEPWSRFKTFVSVTDDNEFYEMTVSVAGSHGTVAYGSSSVTNGTQTFSVKEGTDVVLTVTPDEGYQLTSLTVNGTERKGDVSGGSLTLSSITGDIAVVAKFGAAGNAQQITIGASGMATFCSDSDLDFSTVSGLQAYTGAGFNRETGVLTMLRVSDVPAGTGLVLRGTPGTYEVPYGTSASIYANLLVGVTTATTLSQTEGGYTNYILSNGSHGVGFYIVSGTGELAAGKAYLHIPTSQSANLSRILMDFDSEATGISEIENGELKNHNWFDLQGRRVECPTKGLYIRNGRKVVIR